MNAQWLRLAFGLAAALAVVVSAQANGTARFYYADLSFDGYASANVSAAAINNAGEFVGVRSLAPLAPALPWAGEIAEPIWMVPGFDFVSATASAMNESGQFTGVGTWPNGTKTTYRFTPGVGVEVLGKLDGTSGWVSDINASGAVTGSWAILGGPYLGARAFIYTSTGGFQQLPTLGGHDAHATDINDAGVVVGSSRVSGPINQVRACCWVDGQCLPLGPAGYWSVATHINNAGTILGTYIDAAQTTRGFVQHVGGDWQSVPLPPGATVGVGQDINELGQIVGTSDAGAYIYTPGDDAALVDIEFTPEQINNAGHVVGTLLEPPYLIRAWYWTPETGSVRVDDMIVPALRWNAESITALNDHDEMLVNGFYEDHNVASVIFPVKKGDLNCDGVTDFFDIDPFIDALAGQAHYDAAHPNCNWPSADTNNDGTVNFFDIDGFVALFGT